MVVNRTWRSPDGRWVIDEVGAEPGVEYWLWDEGVLVADGASTEVLDRLLDLVVVPETLKSR